MNNVLVIGGGLAGAEAAWQLANRGLSVLLYEMRPELMTPAHNTDNLAELVCSNSLGALNPNTASGVLKAELKALDSLIVACAEQTVVPAGGALAVDRSLFSQMVTDKISTHPNIEIRREEYKGFPTQPAIIATGPLTSDFFAQILRDRLGKQMLYFYDAASPIIDADSLDYNRVFSASRYDKGGNDYLNCPMSVDEYMLFYDQLVQGQTVELKEFEETYFEHCLPVEVIAKRGPKTLTFGPLKPVGLIDPSTGKQPYAVVQLRREDIHGKLYNMVGFQTNLKWGEQKRIFSTIPGLEQAEFVRYGVMHRNTFINSPQVMTKNFALAEFANTYVAGQLSGVEGYLESTASGLVSALDLWANWQGRTLDIPQDTMLGSLSAYVCRPNKDFQPMNANFGILPPLANPRQSKKERRKNYAQRSMHAIKGFLTNI